MKRQALQGFNVFARVGRSQGQKSGYNCLYLL